jgi:hypothetical protein
MALISTSPLGVLRRGIGGRIVEGTTSSSKSAPAKAAPKPAPKPAAKPKPKPKPAPGLAAVERAEEAFNASPPQPPTPPVPEGVVRAEEGFEGTYSSPEIVKALQRQEVAPVLACMTDPKETVGPGPTPVPTPTAVPPMTFSELYDASCEVARAIDPLQKNPAFVGTNVGIGSILDNLAQGLETVPPGDFVFDIAKTGVLLLESARKTVATTYDFVCQQVHNEGIFYDAVPIDDLVADVASTWEGMTTPEKAVTISVAIALVAAILVLALPK